MLNAAAMHAFVLAGGSGSRLQPLTRNRCKPALPFGGGGRIVDFVLANLLNSRVRRVDVLVQYQPDALVDHLQRHWLRHFESAHGALRIGAPDAAGPGYRGTADAVHQNLARLRVPRGLVLVFGADHVCRMDVRQMVDFHLTRGAEVTVATLPVPLADAAAFGVVGVDARRRVQTFEEKPPQPRAMPGRPDTALASMGNYVFDADVLRDALARASTAGEFDFGQHVLPRLVETRRVFAYDFAAQVAPGVGAHEERAYWRDVGTLDGYFDAHFDTLGAPPRFNLDNPQWPLLRGAEQGAPPSVTGSEVRSSCLGADAVVDRAVLDHVVLGRSVHIEPDAQLERCIVLDGAVVGAGARLRNVIVDAGSTIAPGACIGLDAEHDRARFVVTEGGVVVVSRGSTAVG